jgi:putative ABC transport system permease protein
VGVTRLLSHLLFEIGATDPLTFAGVLTALVAVALVACLLPALRATRVDPITALRG